MSGILFFIFASCHPLKVGEDNEGCESITGLKHGNGVRNDNGERISRFLWPKQPCDYRNHLRMLVNRQHRTSVGDTRVMRGADIASSRVDKQKNELGRWKSRIVAIFLVFLTL